MDHSEWLSDRSEFRGFKPYDVNQLLCGDCAKKSNRQYNFSRRQSVLWSYKDGFILGYVSVCLCVWEGENRDIGLDWNCNRKGNKEKKVRNIKHFISNWNI